MMAQEQFDFCVCGNGMVGSVMALALAKRGFSVAWVAPEKLKPFSQDDKPDLRMSAISLGSISLLQDVGVWDFVLAMRAKPYSSLRVWELDGVETSFNSQAINENCLGYFVENRLIQLACANKMNEFDSVTHFESPMESALHLGESVAVSLADNTNINARWLIGAEGASSGVRQSAGIATRAWRYEQQAMGIIVELNEASGEETWQQFYSSGPRALLPMHSNFASLIWYDCERVLKNLEQLNSTRLITEIKLAFPERLPKIKNIISFARFPLTRMHANCYVKNRCILVGDAAHTVNPLAGQGVNMGFGDVSAIVNVINNCTTDNGLNDNFVACLNRDYNVKHRQRNRLMMTALEAIYHSFKQPFTPVKVLRNIGLFAAQNSGVMKQQVIKFAAGLS